MASLKEYRRKRDFKRTPEPGPEFASSGNRRQYLIQKHDASRLHYDLRLEDEGVLLSWAIPKGPSLVAGDKRLAVRVEDHPLGYGSFEGTIPDDQYGGGTVMLWDRGVWEPFGDPAQGLRKGRLEFRLHGEKLQGSWLLTRMGAKKQGGKENWLLIKRKDASVRPPDAPAILDEAPLSVASGRSLPEIAANPTQVWASDPPSSGKARKRKTSEEQLADTVKPTRLSGARAGRSGSRVKPCDLPNARKASLPRSLRLQRATLAAEPPAGDDWLHEIKFDGYRMLCTIDAGRVRLVTRNANDWTHKFPDIARAARSLELRRAVLDGEVVALTGKGISDFQTLQNAIAGGKAELAYYVFDVPWCEGYDLTRTPLRERKRLLQDLLAHPAESAAIRYCDHIRGHGRAVYESACRLGMEGIVCKRADSVYEGKRSSHWLKVKCIKRQEFVICGYTRPGGTRHGFGALMLAYYDDDRLVWCGRVGTGFSEKLLRDLHRRLSAMRVDEPPVVNPPGGAAGRSVHWVEPAMVAEVRFSEWTDEGLLRQPAFEGLREDKEVGQVVRESVMPVETPRAVRNKRTRPESDRGSAQQTRAKGAGKNASDATDGSTVAGVRLTNPERVLYPEQDLTKLALARFYESIADQILPHITHRPLALVRCPRGRSEKCFYQKHVTEHLPESIKGLTVRESRSEQQTVMIEDLAGLIGLVQIGVLEIHVWGSRADNVEKPDRLVFDLDPGPGVDWEQVNEAARRVRDVLDDLGLTSFVKTSGGKGLHVIAPVTRRQEWDEAKQVCGAIAQMISRAEPDKYLANMAKARRHGRIFIDYLRNGRGATSIAPYSTRARDHAPVSTPVAWEELSARLGPDAFRVDNLQRRLVKLQSDPWAGFFDQRQSITAKLVRKLGL